jgi:hypothetical protein
MDGFTPEVIEHLRAYVYRLEDDRGRTFYVGKGNGNRVFAHAHCALTGEEGLRYDRIRELHSRGLEPRIFIHRHGLDDAAALEVEAALIDAYAGDDLANEVRGYESERGMASDRDVAGQYGAQPAVIEMPAILIKIEKQWRADLTPDQLYERTRRYWTCQPENQRTPPEVAVCVARGIIREVYDIHRWEEYPEMDRQPIDPTRVPQKKGRTKTRRGFLGEVTKDAQPRASLIGKSVRHIPFGSGSPYAYVNCGRENK